MNDAMELFGAVMVIIGVVISAIIGFLWLVCKILMPFVIAGVGIKYFFY